MSTTHINDVGQRPVSATIATDSCQRLLSTTVAKGRCQLQESMTGVDGKGQQLLRQRREKTNQRDRTRVHDSCQRLTP